MISNETTTHILNASSEYLGLSSEVSLEFSSLLRAIRGITKPRTAMSTIEAMAHSRAPNILTLSDAPTHGPYSVNSPRFKLL